MRRLLLLAMVGVLAAGCGGGGSKKNEAPPIPRTPQANAAYERAYSECASTPLVNLAAKYHTTQDRASIAKGVGRGWRKLLGGGSGTARAGEAGCLDALSQESGSA